MNESEKLDRGPQEHLVWVKGPVLPHIESGTKVLEVRLKTSRFASVRVGDTIRFNQKIVRKVSAIREYSDFESLLKSEDENKILPGHTKLELYGLWQNIWPEVRKSVLVFQLGEL